jgi:GTP cyclohydrolase II
MNRAIPPRSDAATKRWLYLAIWLLVLALLGWTLSNVPLGNIWRVLRRLTPLQIGLLLVINGLVVLTFGGRWWALLTAMGHRVPYGLLTLHRLAGFGISYFTPGPQFGGEPVQVLLTRKRHGVPVTTAAASVGMDRLVEVLVNLSLLLAGLVVTLRGQLADSRLSLGLLIPVGVGLLLALPLAYLFLLWSGRTALTNLLARRERWLQATALHRLRTAAQESERRATTLFREKPGSILITLLASLVSWAGIIGEYWLMLAFLGVTLTPIQLISVLTAARIAFLLPMPGGLGTLEAGQVLVFGMLGLDPAVGLSASLLIRGRDVLFGLAGLWWAGMFLRHRGEVEKMGESVVTRMSSARIPTAEGEFELILYRSDQDDKEHLALVMGDPGQGRPLLARVHSECFTGDVLGSRRCDCGDQLSQAMQLIAADGLGVIVYLRQEGRGIGLLDKLRAYTLQDAGYDTVEANLLLGHAPDERDYTVAARIFEDLGVKTVRLMTNNPDKIGALEESGIVVMDRVPLQADVNADNERYLLTKAARMHHLLDVVMTSPEATKSPNGSHRRG